LILNKRIVKESSEISKIRKSQPFHFLTNGIKGNPLPFNDKLASISFKCKKVSLFQSAYQVLALLFSTYFRIDFGSILM